MMQRAKYTALFLLYVALQACTGGSACGGCVEPIPGGFPLDRRIANSAQLRLTPNAITFLETHYQELLETMIPDGLTFDIPESTSNVAGIGDVTICPGGGCTASINLTGVDIQPTPPSSLVVVAQMEVVTSNIRLDIASNWMCLFLSAPQCDVDLDTRRTAPPYQTIRMTLTITIDTRTGYADLDVTEAGLVDSIQNDDLRIGGANTCGDVWCSIANIGFIKDFIVGTLQDQLSGMLTDQIASVTCMTCPDSGCPAGSTCNGDGFCAYSDGTCVPMLLGIEGQMDMGTMLASVSPGLSAPIMFVDAAGGYANVDDNGLNIGLYGGMEAQVRSGCIPPTYTADWLTYEPAPVAPEFSAGSDFTGCRRCPTGSECSTGYTCSAAGRCDDATGGCEMATQPIMVKLGVAERYLNRVGAGLFDAGTLCLGISTAAVPQLNSAMLGLMMSAITTLTWGEAAPIAIEVRPQLPPRFEIGDDPLLSIQMDQTQLDFYLWMFERYVKILTVQMDLTVALELTAETGAIVPTIAGITAANVDVTDAELIGPPSNVNELFADLLELVSGMIPAIDPIALPELSGFVLEVPDGGITHVAQGGEDFLAIYANLAVAPAPSPHMDTDARVTFVAEPVLDRAGRLPVRLDALKPTVTIDAAARGPLGTGKAVDYRWRVDDGPWSSWTRDSRLTVRDVRLVFGGEHSIAVQSRLADDDRTIDPTPAMLNVELGGAARYFPPRHSYDPRRAPSTGLRGRPETDSSSSGCGCAVPGSSGTPTGLSLLGLALGTVVLLRRRRSRVAVLAVLAALGLVASFGCGGSTTTTDNGGGCTADDQCGGGRCCLGTSQCVELPAHDGFCAPGFDCLDTSGNFVPTFNAETCTFTTDCCAELPALLPGLVGSHSELAVASDGTVWVSGYSAGLSERSTYGDLVVGTWSDSADAVDWEHVDGVPTGETPTGAASGWRGGIATPGDDVGRYTTIAIGTDGQPRVAYYDVTNGALKFAVHGASGWTVQPSPVDDRGDAGRYADLAIGPDGRPAISYNSIEERSDVPGAYVSKAKVAWAADAAASSWTISELETVDIPCWKTLCGDEQVCLASTRVCATPDDETACAGGCETGQECVAAACEDVFEVPIDFPEGVGIVTGIDFAPDGNPIVVYYDRGAWDRTAGAVQPHGDLKQAAWSGGAWTVTLLDGSGTDAGWYPTLDVDAAGTHHVAYVDGISESLIYINPDAGGTREVVDGRSVSGRARQIVGDDATIRATASGQVWIAYQDATARSLMLAHRTAPGTWDVQEVDAEDSSGFFANLALGPDGETPTISTYWHRTTPTGSRFRYDAGVRVFTVTP